MASIQTTIPFVQRKKTSIRGKENAVKTIDEKPLSLGVPKSPLSSPNKRSNLSECESSPPKRCSPLNEKSPSWLINSVKITSSEEKTKTPVKKELFPEEDKTHCAARQALHSSVPCRLPGRDDKVEELTDILLTCLREKTSTTVYISGPPGTGKTASLRTVVTHPEISSGYKIVHINCTGVRSSGAIYSQIAKSLGLKSGNTEKAYLAAIEKYFTSPHKMTLLVLDEMDQLESRKQCVLYNVFEWPSRGGSRLVLIGIANALDLTDRVLPRLKSKLALKPRLIHFPPYTRQQIVDIIADRLQQAGVCDVLKGGALQLLAGKVSSISGDVRKALDIARRVIDVATSLEGGVEKEVSLSDVLSVVNNVYCTSQTLVTSFKASSAGPEGDSGPGSVSQPESSYPLQQKLLICSLLLIRLNSKSKDVTIGKLHDVYKKVCQKRNLSALDLSEFLSLADLVESRGVMKMVGKTKNRLSKVIMQWDEKEVSNALQDKQLLAAILSDVSCLPR